MQSAQSPQSLKSKSRSKSNVLRSKSTATKTSLFICTEHANDWKVFSFIKWQNVNKCYAIVAAVDKTHCMTVNERSVVNTGGRWLESRPRTLTCESKTKSTTVKSRVRVQLNSGKSKLESDSILLSGPRIEQCLTFHQTHYRSYQGRFLQVIWPHQQCQSTEGNQLVFQIRLESHQDHSTMLQ